MRTLCFITTVFVFTFVVKSTRASSYRLTLSAAAFDRAGEVIVFPVPEDLRAGAKLFSAEGHVIPIQRGSNSMGCFTVARQGAGEEIGFTLVSAENWTIENAVVADRRPDEIDLSVGGKPLLVYRMDENAPIRTGVDPVFKRAGYLHPILTPGGRIVSDDSPANHPHHHGLWTAWSLTKFQGRSPNFWELAQRKGTVKFVGLERSWGGPVHGGFIGHHRMIDLTTPAPIAVINETWEITAYRFSNTKAAVGLFDLQSTETCATVDALELPTYRYGGLGFRGSGDWDGEQGLAVLTSEGETDRNRANSSRSRWCYLGPAKGGAQAPGIVILGHPENFRAPQPLRVHPDMPFFSFAIPQAGDAAIEPGQPLTVRYRILTLDAAPDQTLFEAYWEGYAHPAIATLRPIQESASLR